MLPLIIGGAATVGSGFLNSAANKKVEAARAAAIAAERERQDALDAEASKLNKGAQDRYKTFGTDMTGRADMLGDMFKAAPTPGVGGGIMPQTGNKLMADVLADRMAVARESGEQQSEALGELRSFGDVLGEKGRLQARDAGFIDQIGSFKRGSAGVNALELEAAAEAGDKYKFWGDVLGGIGKIGISAGLGGVVGPAAAAAGGAGGVVSSALPGVGAGAYNGFPIMNAWNAPAMAGMSLPNMFARR